MPLILGTNSIKDTGYDVANSLRFNSGSSDDLVYTPSSTGNRRTFTWSVWVKRSKLGASQFTLFKKEGSGSDTNGNGNADYLGLAYFNSDDTLQVARNQEGDFVNVKTTRVFRDVSAWYHIIVSIDTTQGTGSNRVRCWINGTEESLTFTVTPTQNREFDFNQSGEAHHLGSYGGGSYLDGYLTECVFLDGTAVTGATDFGEFDSDSPTIWKPKDVSGLSFGTNGFYLDFENASSLGADVSGNGNNFTVNNLTSADQSTDTCTNNFCTMNSLYPDGTITFSEGNLKLTQGSSWRSAGGTMAVSTGKWYWEVSNVGNYAYIGFADIQLFNEGCSIRESFTTGSATTGKAHSVLNSDGRHYQVTSGGAQTSEYPSAATFSTFTNSIIGIALNLDDNNFIFYKDGTAMNPSGTPISITAGTYIPAVSIYGTNVSYNFGSPPYSISSGNSDANGHGNFEYAVPSGYFALCTKNLAEYG